MSVRTQVLAAGVALTAVLAGCRDFSLNEPGLPDTRVLGDVTAEPGVPFRLELGQIARIDAYAIGVRFVEIAMDTRCPRSDDCPSAGQVGVVLEVVRDDRTSTPFQLWVPGLIDTPWLRGDVFQSGKERIRLLWVEPYPESDLVVEDQDWWVLVRVDHDF